MLRGTKFAKYTLKLLLNCDVSVCYGSGKKNKKKHHNHLEFSYHLLLEWGYYREISNWDLDVLTVQWQDRYMKAKVWDIPVMTKWTRLISYLLYSSFSNESTHTSIFQWPLMHTISHLRSHSLNWNKPGHAIKTRIERRNSFFQNETSLYYCNI